MSRCPTHQSLYMQILKVLALRGPSVWSQFPVLEAWVDLGEYNDSSSDEIPGLNERLMAWLPTMIEHRCSEGVRGGFFERLRRGTYPAHILEHITLELQSLAGSDVGYGRARVSSQEPIYRVVVEYEHEDLARECLTTARELYLAAYHNRPFAIEAEVQRLRDLAERVLLGPSTRSIVEAAAARGIPIRRLNNASLVQFGYGRQIRRILAAETDGTSAIGESIAQDKELTRQLLQEVGVPVPAGRPVDSPDDAWAAAEALGVPVVVKPQDGNQGRGVATRLTTREQVVAAYQAALEESSRVLVERFIPGYDHRLLVVGNKLVAAARREPPKVVGDGIHSIRQLVAEINTDPRRGDHHATALSKIPLDEIAQGVLAEQGYQADSIPDSGHVVLMRRNANLSTGGTATDVTDQVHPHVAARAIEAARVIGLDIAGIDVVASDIRIPLEEQRAAILEVNAAPGLRMHLFPSDGKPRAVGQAIIEMMFPASEQGRIPVVAVTGVNGKTTTTRFIAHILKGTGRHVGMTCSDGIYVGERRLDADDCSGPKSARGVLANPLVEAAVLETARGGIVREGLGFDHCDVAVVTNIGDGDHLGLSDIHTVEDLAKVKRVVVEAVLPSGTAVLNAADPLVAGMAAKCPGSVLYFALDGLHPVMVEHRQTGGRTAFVRNNTLILATGETELTLCSLDQVPLTHNGRIAFQVENTLAAAAAAWAVGVPVETIAQRLSQFASNLHLVPGRFNVFQLNGATVILDYGHNTAALTALISTLDQFTHASRTVVYSTAGDRRDGDMIAQGQLLAASFDRVVLYEDHYRRGRAKGEIIGLFRQGMAGGKRCRETHEVQGAIKAVETALVWAQTGELLLIQADEIDETVTFISQYIKNVERDAQTPASAVATRLR